MRANAGIDALRVAVGSRAYAYMEVTNYDGTWINLGVVSYASRTLDFFNGATLRDDIDSNTWSLSAQFAREIGTASLAPFRSDSTVNVDDASAYQPLLDLHRRWRLMVAAPTPLTFREMARGWIDHIHIAGDPAVITIQGRGEEADLIDRRIMFVDATADPLVPISVSTPKTYAGGTIGTVLQAILDEEMGAGVVPLTLDSTAPSTFINGWDQTTSVGLFDLLQQIASIGGAVLRYRYDASDVLTLTLFTPRRDAVPGDEDWTTNARAYEHINASIDLKPIRTVVVTKYVDVNFGLQVVTSPVMPPYPPVTAATARYGVRPFEIDLSADTRVTDQTAAGALTDAARSDTEFPAIEQDLTEVNAWFGELWDYVRTDANGVHYNDDQYGGVTAVEHVFANGMLRSTFGLRGKPAGRYRTWLDFGPGAPRTPFTPAITHLAADFFEYFTPGPVRFAAVQWTVNVNQYTQSVMVEVSETEDFAIVLETQYADVAPDGAIGGAFITGLTSGTMYWVRATPYSGPLAAGLPTGTAGLPVIDPTFAQMQAPTQAAFDTLVADVDALAGTVLSEVGFSVENGDSVIEAGDSDYVRVPAAATITGAELVADVSGSVTVEVWRATYAAFPTFTKISASAPMTLSSAQKSTDTTLTGWTTSLAVGDYLQFRITGTPTTIERLTGVLTLTRT